jgi:hypothetical protein
LPITPVKKREDFTRQNWSGKNVRQWLGLALVAAHSIASRQAQAVKVARCGLQIFQPNGRGFWGWPGVEFLPTKLSARSWKKLQQTCLQMPTKNPAGYRIYMLQ